MQLLTRIPIFIQNLVCHHQQNIHAGNSEKNALCDTLIKMPHLFLQYISFHITTKSTNKVNVLTFGRLICEFTFTNPHELDLS